MFADVRYLRSIWFYERRYIRRWNYVDRDGELLLEKDIARKATDFSAGYAVIRTKDGDVVIDQEGDEVLVLPAVKDIVVKSLNSSS
mgnify:CR=1 FL=1